MSAKIFGIGLHKTGGTSLCKALEELGYSTRHFPNPLGIKDGELILKHEVMQGIDAYADRPFHLLYPTADRYYPGSKFILTIRDKESWMVSAETHFSKIRKFLRGPLLGPHTTQYVIQLYGSKIFNPELFSKTYDRYHENIERYFEDRAEDLLHLNICGGEGWEKLCNFLDKPIPIKPFPHANKKGTIQNIILADIPLTQKMGKITSRFLDE